MYKLRKQRVANRLPTLLGRPRLLAILILFSFTIWQAVIRVFSTREKRRSFQELSGELEGYHFNSAQDREWPKWNGHVSFKIYYYTVSNIQNHGLCLLAKSVFNVAGTTLNVVTETRMTGSTHVLKGEILGNILMEHDPEDVIVFFDAFDVIATGTIQDFALTYAKEFYPKVVVSGHMKCHPQYEVRYKDKVYSLAGHSVPSKDICSMLLANNPNSPRPYVNSGTIIGRATDIANVLIDYKRLIKEGHTKGDQEILTLIHLNHTDKVAVDSMGKLVLTMKMKDYVLSYVTGRICQDGWEQGQEPGLMHFPGFTIPTCILNMNTKYRNEPATWREFETGNLITKTDCMAMFHPNIFDRSDLLMFLEYYPWRSMFILVLIGYCIHYLKREFIDPKISWVHKALRQVLRNPLFSLLLSGCITPVMIFLILVLDDYHDGN